MKKEYEPFSYKVEKKLVHGAVLAGGTYFLYKLFKNKKAVRILKIYAAIMSIIFVFLLFLSGIGVIKYTKFEDRYPKTQKEVKNKRDNMNAWEKYTLDHYFDN